MTAAVTHRHGNGAYAGSPPPRLSVLIPFYRDNPAPLLGALAQSTASGFEVLLFDDGMPCPALNTDVKACIDVLDIPALLISSRLNRGRSGARNRLAQDARSPWLLFLDADMAVDADFLSGWIEEIQSTTASGLFGGFYPSEPTARTRVHAALAQSSDAHSAAQRNAIGPVAVCSSNLAVRAEAFAQNPFDEDYSGWGWEDVDWALSAAAQFELTHIDNPVRHSGLETVDELLAKYSQSGPNFARLLARHPDYANRPGAKLAAIVKALRMNRLARVAGRLAARLSVLPVRLRVLGLKLFRAGIAAEALS